MTPLNSTRQEGVALMAMVLLVFILGSSFLFSAMRPPSGNLDHDVDTAKEMAKAKEALIAYATHYANFNSDNDGPGRLPCPDNHSVGDSSAGTPASSCNWSRAYRLPEFVTLSSGSRFEINDHYAGVDRQFWYAITPAFRHNNSTGVLNSSTAEGLTLDGDSVVAVIIAPGAELGTQTRPSLDITGSDHLEGGNEDTGSADYVSSYAADPGNFNDRVLAISHSEIMTPITGFVAEKIQEAMDYWVGTSYFTGYDFVLNWFGRSYVYDAAYLADLYFPASDWYRTDQWRSAVSSYQAISSTVAEIQFENCASIFTLERGEEITRDPQKC